MSMCQALSCVPADLVPIVFCTSFLTVACHLCNSLNSLLAVGLVLCCSCLKQVVGNRVPVTDCRIQGLDNVATLTCDYPWDLNQTQLSFCVYRMTGDNKDNRERVLSCNWFDGKTICKTESGFGLPERVSNVFTVAIPKSGAEEYCCDIYPSEETTNVKKCHHEQTATTKDCEQSSTVTTESSKPYLPDNADGETTDKHHELSLYVTATFGLLIIALVFLVCLTLFQLRYYNWLKYIKPTRTADSESFTLNTSG